METTVQAGAVSGKAFLAAAWRSLVMLNYEIHPEALKPLIPAGCELDTFRGKHFVSVVGFLFERARIGGLVIPFHANFPEVNLRFYVKRRTMEGWRRGVVFIKEIVPRFAIAATARALYGENYVALSMRHSITAMRVRYEWKFRGRWNSLEAAPFGEPAPALPDSEEEFITEHYWGYTRQKTATLEYRVEHVPWAIWQVTRPVLDCDLAGIYGEGFAGYLQADPNSAFLAEGSPVTVYRGQRIA